MINNITSNLKGVDKMLQLILLILGFILLVKGADYFVDGASLIARRFRIPSSVIGLTIVAFGTSAPELAVSISAALKGNNAIAIGNVVGSNIVNLLIVVGLSALIKPMAVNKSVILKDYPFSILASLSLLLLSWDSHAGTLPVMSLSRNDGLILLLFFIIFMYSLIPSAINNKTPSDESVSATSFRKSLFFTVLGLVGVVAGGNLVVDSASAIASAFGISETIIGLTIVAIGTSLPELVTSLIAARKGESDLAIGNVLGSNIMNIFLILGVSATIYPIDIDLTSITDMIILILVTVIYFVPVLFKKRISRVTGTFMIITYCIYSFYILTR